MSGKEVTLFNAHTGLSIKSNRFYFISIDELKRFCSTQLRIPLNQIFLLSALGLRLKNSNLDEIDEIYVFDKNLFSSENGDNAAYLTRYLQLEAMDNFDSLIQPISSPLFDFDLEKIKSSRNSRQLLSLLTTNLGWAAAIESDSIFFTKKSLELDRRIKVLFKSLKVAFQYIESYCSEITKNYDSTVGYAQDLQGHLLHTSWRDHFGKISQIKMTDKKPLSSLLDENQLKSQSANSFKLNESINNEFLNLKPIIEESGEQRKKIAKELANFEEEASNILRTLNVSETLEELQLLSNRVQKDSRNFLDRESLDNIDMDIILDAFQRHKRDLAGQIYDFSNQIYNHLLSEKTFFLKVQLNLSKILRNLSLVQSRMVTLREGINAVSAKIEEVKSVESSLAYSADLPLLYGLYMIETIRRDQWLQEMKTLTSKTNENLASIREKEIKFRGLWLKNYGVVLKLLKFDISSYNSSNLVSFEIVTNEDKSSSSKISFKYEECTDYIHQLKSREISKEIVSLLLKQLDSIQTRSLQVEITPESLKASSDVINGYKTRIRKLENLLYQQQFKDSSQKWNPSFLRSSSVFRNPSLTEDSELQESKSRLSSPNQQAELAKLINQNNELSIKVKEAKSLTDHLKADFESSKRLLVTQENEVQDLHKNLKTLANEKDLERSKLQSLLNEVTVRHTKQGIVVQEQEHIIEDLKKKLIEKEDLIQELKINHTNREDQSKKEHLVIVQKLKSDNLAREKQIKEENLEYNKKVHSENLEKLKALESRYQDTNKKIESDWSEKLDRVIKQLENEKKLHLETAENAKSVHSTNLENIRNLESELDDMKRNSAGEDYSTELETIKEQKAKDNLKLEIQETIISEQSKRIDRLSTDIKQAELLKENLESKLNESEVSNKELIKNLEDDLKDALADKEKKETELKECREDFKRLKSMKNDLLENMANRETEFAKEKGAHQEEVESLKVKLEELEKVQHDDEDLQVSSLSDSKRHIQTTVQLIIIIESLLVKCRDLSEVLYNIYQLMESSLRTMGMLAVELITDGTIEVKRVKGLRNSSNEMISSVTFSDLYRPVIEKVIKSSVLWSELPDPALLEKLNTNTVGEIDTTTLEDVCDSLIKTYNLTTFEDTYLEFVKNITNLNLLFVPTISKRFSEVERLAKKEIKESRRLEDKNKNKISIRNFEIGDLVLFLPTRNPYDETPNKNNQWAAFNDVGDAKYLMKNNLEFDPPRQWFIGRILQIEKIGASDYTITTEQTL